MAAVTLAQAVWRDVTVQNAVCVQNAIIDHPDRVHQIVNSGDALIARSRSILASRFLDEIPDSDVLVFVDGDIQFEPSDFAKIVEGARATGDVYGGIYVTRAREPHLASLPFREQAWRFERTAERRPLEVRYLATGFMAIPRSLLERVEAGEFTDIDGTHRLHRFDMGTGADRPLDFFRTFGITEADGRTHWLSEDWAFCERARQVGARVWADQAIVLGHQGGITLTVEDLPAGKQEASDQGLGQYERHQFDKTPQHPRVASLPADIAAWAEAPEADVLEDLPRGTAIVAELWRRRGDQELADWYARDDVGTAYALDLAWWHMNGAAQSFLDEIGPLDPGTTVLDFGCGIGTLALMLADAGADVTGYDPNRELINFAQSREAPADAVRFTYTAPVWAFFDLIIATHVFEHLDAAALSETVALFDVWLEPTGELFIQNDWTVDDDHPQHADHAGAFVEAMHRHGFEESRLWHWRRR